MAGEPIGRSGSLASRNLSRPLRERVHMPRLTALFNYRPPSATASVAKAPKVSKTVMAALLKIATVGGDEARAVAMGERDLRVPGDQSVDFEAACTSDLQCRPSNCTCGTGDQQPLSSGHRKPVQCLQGRQPGERQGGCLDQAARFRRGGYRLRRKRDQIGPGSPAGAELVRHRDDAFPGAQTAAAAVDHDAGQVPSERHRQRGCSLADGASRLLSSTGSMLVATVRITTPSGPGSGWEASTRLRASGVPKRSICIVRTGEPFTRLLLTGGATLQRSRDSHPAAVQRAPEPMGRRLPSRWLPAARGRSRAWAETCPATMRTSGRGFIGGSRPPLHCPLLPAATGRGRKHRWRFS